MVFELLFKEACASHQGQNAQTPTTEILRFWLHQSNRVTDGHIAFQPDGTAHTSINLSTKGRHSTIEARAAYDAAMRRDQAGYDEWDDARLTSLLDKMSIEIGDKSPAQAFASAVLAPIRATESAAAEHLSILWDVEDEDIHDAIGLRYHVVQKAEAILNDAGLLVDQMGTVVAEDNVSATIEVTQFAAAKSLLMNTLSADERRYNCRIEHV